MNTIQNYKLVLLGDSGVGKSSIALRFVRDEFREFQEPTIGAAFLTRTLNRAEGEIRYEMWDTAGQERYASLAPMYYRGAKAAVVVYDVTCKASFEGAKKWVSELQRGVPKCTIALAGNKCELSRRGVPIDEASKYSKEQGILFIETSAKTGKNVMKLFTNIANKLPRLDPIEDPLRPKAADPFSREKCC